MIDALQPVILLVELEDGMFMSRHAHVPVASKDVWPDGLDADIAAWRRLRANGGELSEGVNLTKVRKAASGKEASTQGKRTFCLKVGEIASPLFFYEDPGMTPEAFLSKAADIARWGNTAP